MKLSKYKIKMSFLVLAFVMLNCSTDETQTTSNLNNLVWADEFDVDGAPNPEIWNYDLGDGTENGLPAGWGNNELQYYTDRAENIIVEDGMLKITALNESLGGASYTSARINTKDLFHRKYGRFEARMKLPWGQ